MEPMDIKQRIKHEVEGHPVVLFMKGTPQFPQCGFSNLACQVLSACGVSEFHSVDVLADPADDNRETVRGGHRAGTVGQRTPDLLWRMR